MSYRFAVVGHPVAHSRSPDIPHAFARQLGLSVQYDAVDLPEDGFESGIQALIEAGYQGFNVTLPHKEHAYVWVSEHSQRAQLAGAVNTLMPTEHGPGWRGDNTDGQGLVHDLTQIQGLDLSGKRLLILGAGGAVRGVLGPLLECRPQRLHIANRTAARAESLAAHFAPQSSAGHCALTAGGFDQSKDEFDLVINGTSASLGGDIPPVPSSVFAANAHAYDMMYGPGTTPFNAWALAQSVAGSSDGLGMLVGQAAESFRLWTGRAPDVAPVLAQVRKQLKAEAG